MDIKIVLVALCCLMFSFSCTHHYKDVSVECKEDPYLEHGRIQFETHSVKHFIKIVDVDYDTQLRSETGLLKVILTLQNRKKENLWVEIRVTFLDKNGHVLEQTNWAPMMLYARTVTEYSCISLGKQADDYQILIRNPAKSVKNQP